MWDTWTTKCWYGCVWRLQMCVVISSKRWSSAPLRLFNPAQMWRQMQAAVAVLPHSPHSWKIECDFFFSPFFPSMFIPWAARLCQATLSLSVSVSSLCVYVPRPSRRSRGRLCSWGSGLSFWLHWMEPDIVSFFLKLAWGTVQEAFKCFTSDSNSRKCSWPSQGGGVWHAVKTGSALNPEKRLDSESSWCFLQANKTSFN